MSDIGDILTALTADIEAGVSGVTVSLLPTTYDEIVSKDLPYCVLALVDYSVDPLEWGQEERTWTIAGSICQDGGTREQMQTKLEAIRDQIFADQTLGATVDRATFAPGVPFSHSDSQHVFGEFGVRAEKVA
jgi:hypothetical protein